MPKEDLGLEVVSFSQNNSEMTLLQIFTVYTQEMKLIENLNDFTAKNSFNMEIEIPPRQLISKVFKVNLRKKILQGDCKKTFKINFKLTNL